MKPLRYFETMSQETEIQELVNEITNFVNSYSVAENQFIEAMSREHRTLQQSFTRLVLRWLEYCAGIDYRFDDRNKSTHETAKKLIEQFHTISGGINPSDYLPFI